MTPSQHQRVCLIAMVAWTAVGALAGVLKFGWSGLLWAVPGLVVGAIMHKVVMEYLPIRCPQCAGRINVCNTIWPDPWGNLSQLNEGNPADTISEKTTWYRCRQCKFEQKAEWL